MQSPVPTESSVAAFTVSYPSSVSFLMNLFLSTWTVVFRVPWPLNKIMRFLYSKVAYQNNESEIFQEVCFHLEFQ